MTNERVTRVAALLFATFSVGWAAVVSRSPGTLASEMWPAALASAVVFTVTRRFVPHALVAVALLAAASFVLGGRPLAFSAISAVGVAAEALVVAAVLTRAGRQRPRLIDDVDLGRFLSATALGTALAGTWVGVAAWATGQQGALAVGIGTLVGHASSVLVLTPLFVRTSTLPQLASPLEAALQWATLLGASLAVFTVPSGPGLLFMVMPVLGWAALRLRLVAVQLELVVLATVGSVATSVGAGPLAEHVSGFHRPDLAAGTVLQVFFIVCALVVLPLSMNVGRQREAVRAAQRERDMLNRVVDTAHVAIIGTDEIGRINLFNPGAERLLGYRAGHVMGRFSTMFHPREEISRLAGEFGVRDDFVEVALHMSREEHGAEPIQFWHADGSIRTLSLTLKPIRGEDGKAIGYVGTAEDVTEQLRTHEALVEALETERRAREQLQQVDRVKETFVSAVSHELRTPITSITGYLEMLLEGDFGELDAAQRDAVRRIDGNSRRLLSLIDDLLTLSRVQQEGLVRSPQQLDLRQVVSTACDVVAPAWQQRSLEVSLDLPDDPASLVGDEDMLERVVVNLVGNAVKFTPDGGRVRVALDRVDGHHVIEVSDTGIGIPSDEQDRVFSRFFRSSTAQSNAIPGSGLGLSIARAIVEGHGGTVEVDSVEGDGTTFRVRLPTAP